MMTLVTTLKNYWIAFTLFLLAVIASLSLWPQEFLPPVPGGDKIHHLIAYAALMFPTALRKPKYWKSIGLSFIAFSGMIELLQPYVNRYGEWPDMAANTAGVVCGLLLAKLMSYFSPVQVKYPR